MDEIAGVIVAGGAGTRAGGRKSLLPFGSGTLLDAVIARVRPQVGMLALNVPASESEFYRTRVRGGFLLLHDDATLPPIGPLGGVLAGLEWAARCAGRHWLASFPGDTPFLPNDLVAQLRASATDSPVAAADAARTHALCAIWPVACAESLRSGIMAGRLRSMLSAVEGLGGKSVQVRCEPDAFFNVNTKDDLAAAESIRSRRRTP